MSERKYPVFLTPEERDRLLQIVKTGTHPAYEHRVARVLLHVDQHHQAIPPFDDEVARMCETTRRTVVRIRKRMFLYGLSETLSTHYSHPRPQQRCLDGEGEAHLIALACSPSPEGTQRWTLRLLAARMVELKVVDHLSYTTVGEVLKKMSVSLG